MKFIWLFFLTETFIQLVNSATIKYDQGNVIVMTYDAGDKCSTSTGTGYQTTYTQSITFNGVFTNTPQIMIFIQNYHLQSDQAEFTFDITSLTKLSFSFKVLCYQADPLYTYIFQWVAVDDKRIQIINDFSKNVTGQASTTFTYTHTLPDVKYGFVTLVNMGIKGAINYQLTIPSITSTQVSIQYTKNTNYLRSIGFQIILGTDEAFLNSDLKSVSLASSSVNSYTLQNIDGYQFFLALVGCDWSDNAHNFRIRIGWDNTTSTSSYSLQSVTASYTAFRYTEVSFNFQNSKVRVPMLCNKWKVSKKWDKKTFGAQLYIKELNQYFSVGYSDSIIIDDTISTLNMIASFTCSSVYKVSGTFQKLLNSAQQTQNVQTNYYGGMNLLELNLHFIQQDWVYQKVQITVTSKSITIIQSVVSTSTQGTILQLSLVRQ